MLNYRALLIDHDDTAVDSTPHIHYPAHLEQLRRLGRADMTVTLEEWLSINYHPGLGSYLNDVLKLSEEDKEMFYRVWREFTENSAPPFFPGLLRILKKYHDSGGVIIVVSHSEPDIIRLHYEAQTEIPGFVPDMIIGWTGEPEKHKPNPWPIEEAIRHFGVSKHEILVLDDLKPGITMAKRGGVDSAGAGWGHSIPHIRKELKVSATYYLENVRDLEKILFKENSDSNS